MIVYAMGILRQGIRTILGLAVFLIACWFAKQEFLGHFLSAKEALIRQGLDSMQLGRDQLLGRFFASVGWGRVTLADVLAALLAGGELLCLVIVFSCASKVIRLLLTYSVYDETQRRDYWNTIVNQLFPLAVCGGLLWFLLSWDLALYEFRSVAQWLSRVVDDPDRVDVFMKRRDLIKAEYAPYWVIEDLEATKRGYLSVTIFAAFFLEFALIMLSNRVASLEESITARPRALPEQGSAVRSASGHPDPALDQAEPTLPAGDGQAEADGSSRPNVATPPVMPIETDPDRPGLDPSGNGRNDQSRVGFDRLNRARVRPTGSNQPDRLYPVIGEPGRSVTLAEIAHSADYLYDPESDRVFHRRIVDDVPASSYSPSGGPL